MKVIDKSLYQSPDGNIGFFNRISGSFAYGSSWYKDMLAQREVMRQLARVLDNRYVLLRNVVLPGSGVPIPLILVGPTGIWVLLVSGMRGIYRAKDEDWMSMEGGRFKPVRPNMVTRSMLMVRALDAHLRKESISTPEIKSALLFTDAGMHVDAVHPAVRVVLSDAMDRFVAGLVQDSGAFRTTAVEAVVISLVPERQGITEQDDSGQVVRQEDDIFSMRDDASRAGRGRGNSWLDSIQARASLSSGQWIVLGLIFGIWILLLAAFAFGIIFLF